MLEQEYHGYDRSDARKDANDGRYLIMKELGAVGGIAGASGKVRHTQGTRSESSKV